MKLSLSKFAWVLISLYASLGILLFMLVPELDEMHSFWYDDWKTTTNPLIQAYHLPSLIWLGMSGVFIGLIYGLNVIRFSLKTQKMLNLLLLLLWIILVIHVVDWLSMFNFCHQSRCSGLLPTWRLLGLVH